MTQPFKSQPQQGRENDGHTRMVVEECFPFDIVELGVVIRKAFEYGRLYRCQYQTYFRLLLSDVLPGNRDLSSGSTSKCWWLSSDPAAAMLVL